MERTFFLQFFFASLLLSCKSTPVPVKPINNFDIEKYAGYWYEIARIDNRFEKGLTNVSAEYILVGNSIKIVNKGVKLADNKYHEVRGKAIFAKHNHTGHLKVSFWGPWYGNYIIFYLDKNYQYAFIAGDSHEYLWLLSKTPTIDESIVQQFKEKAQIMGFDVNKIIMVDQQINISKLQDK
jgi:apolipoprotein D and lipocalin family protein